MTNAYIAYSKMTGAKQSSLVFRRNVTLALLTLGKPPKVGRPLSVNASPLISKKRREEKFSTPDTVRKQNLGVHWPEFGNKRARCEVCSINKVEARPYSFCNCCKVHLCIQKNKNCSAFYLDLL